MIRARLRVLTGIGTTLMPQLAVCSYACTSLTAVCQALIVIVSNCNPDSGSDLELSLPITFRLIKLVASSSLVRAKIILNVSHESSRHVSWKPMRYCPNQ